MKCTKGRIGFSRRTMSAFKFDPISVKVAGCLQDACRMLAGWLQVDCRELASRLRVCSGSRCAEVRAQLTITTPIFAGGGFIFEASYSYCA